MSDGVTSTADLRNFLSGCRLLSEEGVIWGPTARFVVRAYAADTLPPLELVTSVRCVVTRTGDVLVLSRGEGSQDAHVVPGGRRESGESLEETLRREVLEETGWSLGVPRLLGCVVYRHVDEEPPGYPFPYPEFAQVTYTAEAESYHADALHPDEVDGVARFVPLAEARRLPMARAWSAFLELAAAGADR
jgi:ADP-ribose pyrophosphatase YjhB (NUDIX family)